MMIFEHRECRQLAYRDVVQIMALTESIWPREEVKRSNTGNVVERYLKNNKHAEVFLVWDGDALVAHARVFPRVIFVGEQSLEVMALAGVCVSPEKRCQGLGRFLVKKAFGLIDLGRYRVSLFQTGIPLFYEKLGARERDNIFYNSRNSSDPHGNPWWERSIMVYPGHCEWPKGRLDLNGPAY